jgi:hypothetical protein
MKRTGAPTSSIVAAATASTIAIKEKVGLGFVHRAGVVTDLLYRGRAVGVCSVLV